jgi:hypothetical protein
MQIRTRSLCLALAAGMGLASVAHAGDPQPQDASLYFNGVKVSIDPATGRLRPPTAEELQALRASVKQMPASRSLAKPLPATRADAQRTIRKLPDGSVKARIAEDMLNTVVATRNADGSISFNESTGEAGRAQEAGRD